MFSQSIRFTISTISSSPISRIKPFQDRASAPTVPTAKDFHVVVEAQNEAVGTHTQQISISNKLQPSAKTDSSFVEMLQFAQNS